MKYTTRTLTIELENVLDRLDVQMQFLVTEAARMGVPLFEVRNRDGSWPMLELLSAQATALGALATLKQSEKQSAEALPEGFLPANACKGEPRDQHPNCTRGYQRHSPHMVS
jgi:hypothetical protein